MTHAKTPDTSGRKESDPKESDKQRRRNADLDAATHPASGASVSAAFAGASLAANDDESESEQALKRAAAKNDGGRNG